MPRKNKTSKTGLKEPVNKPGFWLNPDNHFWENNMYTEKGKEMCRKMIKRIKEDNNYDDTTLNRNHL